ncbi:uncharacterized protein LOC133180257 [Saccostrea echinata]|uniref:uncharacterized protein LOC133180257 n=1 Tax=Saccostrea echinata TaxID=191078 RepID=UPI002A83D556|nr:uncharacterized protein LOC133180257 [Saccostrea echinata]
MRQERKWGRFVQGNPLSSNLHAGASVTTLLSTASSRNEDKPKVTVSEYPTLKISQDRDKCFDSYNTIMRDESDFQQNRRSIPIFFTSNTDRNKMKSSTLPDSRLHSNIHRSSRDNAKRDKKQEKHTKKGLRSFENDIDQRVLHTVESAEDFSFQKHMTVRSQDTRSQDTNPVRYSLVQNVISRPQDPESKSKQSAVRYSLVKNVSENFSLNN